MGDERMNVLSLFDGKSSGYTALELAGIPVDNYYSSEVDKYAIQVSNAIHPNQIRLGDVTKWREWDIDWASIDKIIAGSPCQGFSFAGDQLAFNDPRSALFFVFIDILNHTKKHNPNVFFMLENVKMKSQHENVITKSLGVSPRLINSSLLSAQNRQRLYWTNIPKSEMKMKDVQFGDIREWSVDDSFYYSEKAFNWLSNHAKRKGKDFTVYTSSGKFQMLEASMYKKYSSQRFFGILDHKGIRYPTPRECFRLQTVPEHYIDKILACGVSNTQLYKIAGNGWTDEVIAHIFRAMK
jgi:DNA-cytosine methyltransferase